VPAREHLKTCHATAVVGCRKAGCCCHGYGPAGMWGGGVGGSVGRLEAAGGEKEKGLEGEMRSGCSFASVALGCLLGLHGLGEPVLGLVFPTLFRV